MTEIVDKNGKIVKIGDRISFTLFNGIPDVQFTVMRVEDTDEWKEGCRIFDGKELYPLLMKYLEFEIITNKPELWNNKFNKY